MVQLTPEEYAEYHHRPHYLFHLSQLQDTSDAFMRCV